MILGLLCGYGWNNANLYQIYENLQETEAKESFCNKFFRTDEETDQWAYPPESTTQKYPVLPIEKIALPRFLCADYTYEHYAIEREHTAKLFQDKDFFSSYFRAFTNAKP